MFSLALDENAAAEPVNSESVQSSSLPELPPGVCFLLLIDPTEVKISLEVDCSGREQISQDEIRREAREIIAKSIASENTWVGPKSFDSNIEEKHWTAFRGTCGLLVVILHRKLGGGASFGGFLGRIMNEIEETGRNHRLTPAQLLQQAPEIAKRHLEKVEYRTKSILGKQNEPSNMSLSTRAQSILERHSRLPVNGQTLLKVFFLVGLLLASLLLYNHFANKAPKVQNPTEPPKSNLYPLIPPIVAARSTYSPPSAPLLTSNPPPPQQKVEANPVQNQPTPKPISSTPVLSKPITRRVLKKRPIRYRTKPLLRITKKRIAHAPVFHKKNRIAKRKNFRLMNQKPKKFLVRNKKGTHLSTTSKKHFTLLRTAPPQIQKTQHNISHGSSNKVSLLPKAEASVRNSKQVMRKVQTFYKKNITV